MIVVRLSETVFDFNDRIRCIDLFSFVANKQLSKVWHKGSIDFTFKSDHDATLFLLKFGGEVIDKQQQTV
jgi:hypothetical protein